jgi:hypothetical protein
MRLAKTVNPQGCDYLSSEEVIMDDKRLLCFAGTGGHYVSRSRLRSTYKLTQISPSGAATGRGLWNIRTPIIYCITAKTCAKTRMLINPPIQSSVTERATGIWDYGGKPPADSHVKETVEMRKGHCERYSRSPFCLTVHSSTWYLP